MLLLPTCRISSKAFKFSAKLLTFYKHVTGQSSWRVHKTDSLFMICQKELCCSRRTATTSIQWPYPQHKNIYRYWTRWMSMKAKPPSIAWRPSRPLLSIEKTEHRTTTSRRATRLSGLLVMIHSCSDTTRRQFRCILPIRR